MGSRAKRNFSARLLPESNVEKKQLEFVGKWSARRDEPLDPQEGRGLVFFVRVIWQESRLLFLAKTNMGALDR